MTIKLTVNQLSKIKKATNGSKEDYQFMIMQCKEEMKDVTIAYILGGLFWYLGAHRFYAGQLLLPILQIILLFLGGIGFIWVLADVVLTKSLIEDVNNEVVDRVIQEYKLGNS